MNYAELITLFETIVTKYKGNLYFGTGTFNELNANDSRDYPLVWLNQPVNKSITLGANNLVLATYNVTLQFLQSESLTILRESADKTFNDLEKIATAFIGKIISDFDTGGTDSITVTGMNQVYKKQDSIHVGWSVGFSITTDHSLDYCCSLFED